jgi:hypothetical protein
MSVLEPEYVIDALVQTTKMVITQLTVFAWILINSYKIRRQCKVLRKTMSGTETTRHLTIKRPCTSHLAPCATGLLHVTSRLKAQQITCITF